MPTPTRDEVIITVQRIVAGAYDATFDPANIRPEWHLHSPWPPIGMDTARLAQMLPPLNAYIGGYKPGTGLTPADLAKTDTVVNLVKLVMKKIGV